MPPNRGSCANHRRGKKGLEASWCQAPGPALIQGLQSLLLSALTAPISQIGKQRLGAGKRHLGWATSHPDLSSAQQSPRLYTSYTDSKSVEVQAETPSHPNHFLSVLKEASSQDTQTASITCRGKSQSHRGGFLTVTALSWALRYESPNTAPWLAGRALTLRGRVSRCAPALITYPVRNTEDKPKTQRQRNGLRTDAFGTGAFRKYVLSTY